MTRALTVVKLGGDALISPERIADAARSIAVRSASGPVVVVASARRGVTDRLLALVEQVEGLVPERGDAEGARTAAERAVSAGEAVSASLLAVALERLGVRAAPLDGRQAGLVTAGPAGAARLAHVRTRRLRRYIDAGIVPVVMGYQGWQAGRVTTLGRGGSDVTAVAVAAALDAGRCELVKESGGLHTADPRIEPDARLLAWAPYAFLVRLARAGAKVVHPLAAALAERHRVPLRLSGLHGGAETDIGTAPERDVVVQAVAWRHADDAAVVTVVTHPAPGLFACDQRLYGVAERSGATLVSVSCRPGLVRFAVPLADAVPLVRALHAALMRPSAAPTDLDYAGPYPLCRPGASMAAHPEAL